MSKHTPGPWFVNTASSGKAGQPFKIDEIYVYAPDIEDAVAICADVIDPVTQEPSEANARLIAAAPDLLEALELLVAGIEGSVSETFIPLVKARAAIAKATGEKK